jgi:hypothetical protein
MKNHDTKYKTYTNFSISVILAKDTFLKGKDQPLTDLNKSFKVSYFHLGFSKSSKQSYLWN